MDALSPLPRSLDPLPGEALPGYLLRLAHRLEQPPIRIAAITGLTTARTVQIPGRFLLQLSAAEASRFCRACRLTPQETAGYASPASPAVTRHWTWPSAPGPGCARPGESPGSAAGCSPRPPGTAPSA
jgi:hypothetical protein